MRSSQFVFEGERSESSLPSPTCLSRGYWTAVRLGIFFPLVMFPFRPRPQRSGIIHDDFQNGVVLAGVFSEERVEQTVVGDVERGWDVLM